MTILGAVGSLLFVVFLWLSCAIAYMSWIDKGVSTLMILIDACLFIGLLVIRAKWKKNNTKPAITKHRRHDDDSGGYVLRPEPPRPPLPDDYSSAFVPRKPKPTGDGIEEVIETAEDGVEDKRVIVLK